MTKRIEKDSLGSLEVPGTLTTAYRHGTGNQFPNQRLADAAPVHPRDGPHQTRCRRTNLELGLIDKKIADAIVKAATEVVEGKLDDQFPVDVFQTGSGTSTNMNANEVIASRANEILGGKRGGKSPVHPNDHVNLCQSSNDVFPTAIHISTIEAIREELVPALEHLQNMLAKKSHDFDKVTKIGRTHLQDATPIRLGQEFSGYAAQMEKATARATRAVDVLSELPLGGTAVGTGLNAHPEFAKKTIARLNEDVGATFLSRTGESSAEARSHKVELRESRNHFEAAASRDACVEASGHLKTIAVSLAKIANDIRLLGSGPRCGIGELRIPAVQPGSWIMPGKVNNR